MRHYTLLEQIQKLPLILTLAICSTAIEPCAGEQIKPVLHQQPLQKQTVNAFWSDVMDSLKTHSIASQEAKPDRKSLHLVIIRSFRNCSEYTLTQGPKLAHIKYTEWSRKRKSDETPFPIVKKVSSTADTSKTSQVFNKLTELGVWIESADDKHDPDVDDGDVWLIEISDGKRFKTLDRSQGRGFDSIEPMLRSLAGIDTVPNP